MKLKAVLNDQQHELELDLNGSEVVAGVDGRNYSLQVPAADESHYLILNGTNVYECRVTGHAGSLNNLDVTVRGKTYPVSVIDPRKLRTDGDSERRHHGPAEIAAQMPGKVVRVLVQTGQEIAAGTSLLVVEAMKMQNEMKSPRAGIVVSVNVSAGDTVEAGQLLVMVE